LGGSAPFLGRGAGSPSNAKSPRAEAYLHTKWNFDLCSHLAAADMGRKLGGCAPLGGGAGCPSNTMWPGPRPTCMSSFILIRETVWPQYTNVTDRQTGQERQTDRQRSDSIGRTVLQTVAQKLRMDFLVELGRRISSQSGDVRESSYLLQRISVMIQLFNSVLLHDSLTVDIPNL